MKLKVKRKQTIRKVTKGKLEELRVILSNQGRSYFTDFVNAPCLKCGSTQEVMIRINALFFCGACFLEEFDHKAKQVHKPTYFKWRRRYSKKLKKGGKI